GLTVGLIGPAALAGPETGLLRILGSGVEGDIFPPGLARPAGRPAIDPGGRHRIIEFPIGTPVTPDHRPPAIRVAQEWLFGFRHCFTNTHHPLLSVEAHQAGAMADNLDRYIPGR